MPMYKLLITITDDTGSIDTIAFSFIAEDLVERSAYHASQNMKIDATEHVVALDKAIGKTRLFYIGMSTNSSSTFSIKYVLRKSFPIENPSSSSKDPTPQATPVMTALPSPPPNTGSESSSAKRSLDFKDDIECNEKEQTTTSQTLPKRQRPEYYSLQHIYIHFLK
ncbi:uncharacterized protein LOC120643797 [Panicum virgatum]|uniref:uncharacterized protein LOC120643797 n=1 Tax=Panicum virgatum TaxID=38727 RepID=UPI0019D5F906|nr:uncharacterized protein LOC120643797 [Panicum virgatum]